MPQSTDATEAAPPAAPVPRIACRRMGEGDVEAALALLARGFPERGAAYWRRGLGRLRERAVPAGYPRFGYVLTDGDRPVGVLLLIIGRTDEGEVRGNMSSWTVEPAYRAYSAVLAAAPLRLGITLFNISPARQTIPMIEAQGFRRYVAGTFHALAALGPPVRGARVRALGAHDGDTPPAARAAPGCLSLLVEAADGGRHPFVFLPRRVVGHRLPCAQLVYCRDLADFIRFAGPLGRRLLRHGLPLVMLDANGPVRGLLGVYRDGTRAKYVRGPRDPRLGDLADSELVLFGP